MTDPTPPAVPNENRVELIFEASATVTPGPGRPNSEEDDE